MGDALLGGDADGAGGEVDDHVGSRSHLCVDLRKRFDGPVGAAFGGPGVDVDDGRALLRGPCGLLADLARGVRDGRALVAGREDARESGGDDGPGHGLNRLGCLALSIRANSLLRGALARGRSPGGGRARQGCGRGAGGGLHTGMLPCLRHGRSTFLVRACSRPWTMTRRVSAGSITSSIIAQPAAR